MDLERDSYVFNSALYDILNSCIYIFVYHKQVRFTFLFLFIVVIIIIVIIIIITIIIIYETTYLLIQHVNEGNEWPEYPVFGPSDPSPKAFTDPQKTGSKTSESTPT